LGEAALMSNFPTKQEWHNPAIGNRDKEALQRRSQEEEMAPEDDVLSPKKQESKSPVFLAHVIQCHLRLHP
jgi:hypothetical protein